MIRDKLYMDGDLMLYGEHVVVLVALGCTVLARLHDNHCKAEATKRPVRQRVYWPSSNADITNTVAACEPYQQLEPSQQHVPYLCDNSPTLPI